MRSQILFLSQCLPFPPDSGVTNRTYHILQQLQRSYDVTLVAFSRRNHQANGDARSAATAALRKELTEVGEPVVISSEWSTAEKLRIHLASLFSRKPYTFYEYGNPDFGRELKGALARTSPDIVHIDSMDLYRWVPVLPAVPIACTHHNVESDLLRLRGERMSNAPLGAYVRHQAREVEKVERRLCRAFDVNVMTSSIDAERMRTLVPGARTSVIPNGVDVDYFSPTPPEAVIPGRVIFLGPTYMFPNLDGIEFFLESVWPIVRQKCPEATLDLVGKSRPGHKEKLERHPGVTSHGYVPDIRPYFANAACSIVPLRVGGGTRLKILDAWSMGKAIVSTAIGCEGLETVDGENILVRDDPTDFANAVVEVLRNAGVRQRLAQSGRKTAEEIYAWPVIGQKLRDLYASIAADGKGTPARHATEISAQKPPRNIALG